MSSSQLTVGTLRALLAGYDAAAPVQFLYEAPFCSSEGIPKVTLETIAANGFIYSEPFVTINLDGS